MATVTHVVAADSDGLETARRRCIEGNGAGVFECTDAGTVTHVPLAAAIQRQLCDLVTGVVAQGAAELSTVAQHHVHLRSRAVDDHVAAQAAVVRGEADLGRCHRAAISEHGIADPQQSAANQVTCLTGDNGGIVECQFVVASLQPQRWAVQGLDLAVVEHQPIPVGTKYGDVGTIGARVRSQRLDVQGVRSELCSVHLHDAERGCAMGGDRAAVQLYVRGTAAQEHTTGHRTVGRNVEIPGTDPGVGRWRVAAGSAQAVDAIAMGINAATGDRRVATPYVHTVAIPVVTKGADHSVAQVRQRVGTGQPDTGTAIAHGEVRALGGQLAPAVDVDAVAAGAFKAGIGDFRCGERSTGPVSHQSDAAAVGGGGAPGDAEDPPVVNVEVAIDDIHVAQRQHASAAACGQAAAGTVGCLRERHRQ